MDVEDRKIVLMNKSHRRKASPEIATENNILRVKRISVTTIRRRIVTTALYETTAMSKPLLRKQNNLKKAKLDARIRSMDHRVMCGDLPNQNSKFATRDERYSSGSVNIREIPLWFGSVSRGKLLETW